MAIFQNAGESIECNASYIAIRGITKRAMPLNIQKIDGNYISGYKYKTKVNCTVVITQELVPKIAIISASSNLNLNDTLKADTLEVFTERKIRLHVESNATSRHGIQENNVIAFTYAKIIAPFRFIL